APMTSCAASCSCGTPAPARHVSVASLSDEAKEHTIVINGVSKSHAMTGWRIGYAAGPKAVIQAITKLLGQTTSGSCSISQKAAVAALRMPPETVESMRKVFDERRRFMVARLRSIRGVSCSEPLGAFYAFPDIRGFMGKKLGAVRISSCMEFAKALLEKKEVAIVPGMAFGAPGFARLSYAASMETLKKGLDRIEELLGEMH
ncbi:MAG: aminotransferase class I/II-fold pyridoxal phosphate-dependent enzyme, partial [Planctomycetota bacterium]|nr:aminotransferase class I/II-fold pyridoxal phosphate-dependent enzyme [Planctomycetota bacterium]